MRWARLFAGLAALAGFSMAAPSAAQTGRAPAQRRESVHPLSRDRLPDGNELIAVEVHFPPGAAALPHRHPAFVYAYVLSGTIVSAVGGARPTTYRAGQSWHEEPDAFHRVTMNASSTRPARLLALFIAKPGTRDLVQPVSGSK
jgi:quercetin dioxygenase-like cupin family protein